MTASADSRTARNKPTVLVDNELSLYNFPDIVEHMICDALTVENPDWEQAQREHLLGVPRYFHLARNDLGKGALVIPRGFYDNLERGLGYLGYHGPHYFSIIDHTHKTQWPARTSSLDDRVNYPKLRPYQSLAVSKMNSAKFGGILCLPTGSGKTLIAATFIRERRFRTLVVVDRISIKHQWEKMLVEYGLGDALEAREIQVSTQQSLWSARQKWDWGSEQYREWSSKFGCVILDECHKAPARTFYEVLSSIPALYRFGLSATPNKSGKIALAEAVLGPVLYDYPLEKLQVAGVLGRPHVVISPTTFEFEYRGTEKTKNGSISRNNYADLCEKLIADNKRNALIARKACDAYLQGRKCLVVSSRIDHLKRLEALVSPSCSTTMLTGREPRHKRVATIDFLTENGSPVVVFSTLASEALDIPSLDTLILAYPIRNQDALRQYVGRIIRTYPTKESPQVHDFHDIRVPVLIRQYRDRVSVYRSSGYDVRYLA